MIVQQQIHIVHGMFAQHSYIALQNMFTYNRADKQQLCSLYNSFTTDMASLLNIIVHNRIAKQQIYDKKYTTYTFTTYIQQFVEH